MTAPATGDRRGCATLDNAGKTRLLIRAYKDSPSVAFPGTVDRLWRALREDRVVLSHYNQAPYTKIGRLHDEVTPHAYYMILLAMGYTVINNDTGGI